MRILGPVVGTQSLLMASRQVQIAKSSGIGAKLVGHDDGWDEAPLRDQATHEFQRGRFVPPRLHQHVEDLAFVVDGAPEIVPPALDRDDHLIQMPRPRGPWSQAAQVASESRAELVHPTADALIDVSIPRSANSSSTSR